MVKRYTVNGVTGTLPEIARHFNIYYNTLCYRLEQGMSLEEAVLAKKYNKGVNKSE